ncbi:hypothetical protein CLU81_0596 [Flavobacterium sp. 9]|uniref:hypothetical protein n=1 Tax=Flavobacterium sp. 9 TaxID=2035198 RepID=UPI000C4CC320|nr:hypothetical protein [Flavobacterium sp. 9]PIF30188.1 hypothetical protein CLU81_0596 [Flavobacterium sp. 9]
MRNLINLFNSFVCLLVFNSNSRKVLQSNLPKKIVDKYNDEDLKNFNITYSGNRIIRKVCEENGFMTKYTYSGNVISKIEEIVAGGVIDLTMEFTYSGKMLISSLIKILGNEYHYKREYIYNIDGTVSYTECRINVFTGTIFDEGSRGKFTFKTGNLIKKEKTFMGDKKFSIIKFDDKYAIFKNVLGFDLLLDYEAMGNNIVSVSRVSEKGTSVCKNIYSYNGNGYPVEIKIMEDGKFDRVKKIYY